ncbi:DegT/DnrJ/EryC1/StrS family aminotransferase [Thermoproteota archaeon]
MRKNKENKPVKNNKNYLIFGCPKIEEAEINEVIKCLRSGWLGTGPKVRQFEEDFRTYKHSPYAIAVNSCTAALHLSILAAGIGPGDEIITTAMTFCATVNAIIHSGAKPVIVDCDFTNFCIDPALIRAKITSRTKAIIPVHFAGNACDMNAIMSIAKEYNLKVIEDCAHAIETTYKGRPVGTIGDFGCFSFYVTKNVVTGEGGMVLTKKNEYAGLLKNFALHGMSKDAWKRFSDDGYRHYQVIHAGFKYNMMDLQAAIGIHQLKRVEENWRRRKILWNRYKEAFRDLPLRLPAEPLPGIKHGYHLFTVLIDEKKAGITRDAFLLAMHKENIGTGVHYRCIPSHPYYEQTYNWRASDYPNSKQIGEQTASIPFAPKLSNSDTKDVIRAVKKILRKK